MEFLSGVSRIRSQKIDRISRSFDKMAPQPTPREEGVDDVLLQINFCGGGEERNVASTHQCPGLPKARIGRGGAKGWFFY